MSKEVENGHPSTAYLDEKRQYIPCPLNQPYAYQDRSVPPSGQRKHPVAFSGYCAKHIILGCELCSAEMNANAA